MKVAYLGRNYNGFEYHANNKTRLPTVEEELWKALAKTKLLFKDDQDSVNWEGCEYSKAGRTDKGVSAFGQVIGIRVRSNRPMSNVDIEVGEGEDVERPAEKSFDPIRDEIPYPRYLNRVLPEDIRVLAWCPSLPEDFSARFSCRQRKYRYFFTQPAHCPIPGSGGLTKRRSGLQEREGWLDIESMRNAAQRFLGWHDFRNFHKLDPSRQTTNFERWIQRAEIEEVPFSSLGMAFVDRSEFAPISMGYPERYQRVYSFTVWGSAFLYHQVRHMVAVLFLIGQGFEEPSTIDDLLDIDKTPRKPMYEIADEHPLVLWDCLFPGENALEVKDSLLWIYPDDQHEFKGQNQAFHSTGNGRYGPAGVNESLWALWYRKKLDEVLSTQLLEQVVLQEVGKTELANLFREPSSLPPPANSNPKSARHFNGGDILRSTGTYVPIAKRATMEPADAVNARWAKHKGFQPSGVASKNTSEDDDAG